MAANSEDCVEAAFARLDTALERLEDAVAKPNPENAELEDLKRRHAAMRSAVGEALSELDGLLAGMETAK